MHVIATISSSITTPVLDFDQGRNARGLAIYVGTYVRVGATRPRDHLPLDHRLRTLGSRARFSTATGG
jgi:hypothetical protein